MASKREEKVQKNLSYVRGQITELLRDKYYIKLDIFNLYYNKNLKKLSKYSRVTFPKEIKDVTKDKIDVDIDYETLLKGRKKDLIDIAFRCGVQIGQYYTGRPFEESHEEVRRKYAELGVYDYGGLPEMGLDLHEYRCSECKKVWFLQKKKLPRRKDPEVQGIKTGCCHAPFKYEGVKYYDNAKLQKIKRAKENKIYY